MTFLRRLFHRHRWERVATHHYHDGSETIEVCRCGERRRVFRDAEGNVVNDVRCWECSEWRSACGCATEG